MHKKFEINRTKIKGGCQSGRKVVTHDSKNDLPPERFFFQKRKGKKIIESKIDKIFKFLKRSDYASLCS